MSTSKAQYEAAEALYKAITEEVARAKDFGTPAAVLEQLAHAYSLVAEARVIDPDAPKKGRGAFVG
ncbi:hypothetical protein MCHIJ_43190 [Mycolicibacterium chitae]|uniref:Uncharacterized protein n=1 Tax=Mycolicibacterium chitae TaxID=1792 RepID=A0A448I7K7_MYCCI|nr:hypothetical protein [Mycolicibacterium chitae]MCV7104214.1 hypothetical protein [Mycolicibacterium chitae]BBZ04882.1 hypothetical protein MCHIJ_43190 [Mycolicibacterium chitae]VEG48506.1 Uncharacterised protein [Mycolicibacterium chitae]